VATTVNRSGLAGKRLKREENGSKIDVFKLLERKREPG
jgi:hypothetical protein